MADGERVTVSLTSVFTCVDDRGDRLIVVAFVTRCRFRGGEAMSSISTVTSSSFFTVVVFANRASEDRVFRTGESPDEALIILDVSWESLEVRMLPDGRKSTCSCPPRRKKKQCASFWSTSC